MGRQYARGERAWGICGRSGRKMLLKDMVFDGRYPNMRVDPDWYEARHPLETLPMVDDPVALYRPSPEVNNPPSAPQVTLVSYGPAQINVTWTPAESDITEIAGYNIFRSTNGGTFAQIATCTLQRDFLGGITGITNATFPQYPEHPGDPWTTVPGDQPATYVDTTVQTGFAYCYYVEAVPLGNNQSVGQGPPVNSPTVCLTQVPMPPVLAGSYDFVGIAADLTWSLPGAWPASVQNFQIYRSAAGGGFSLLTTVSGTTLSYADTTATDWQDGYQYYVIAQYAGGNSAPSNTASFPNAVTTTYTANAMWPQPPSGTKYVRVRAVSGGQGGGAGQRGETPPEYSEGGCGGSYVDALFLPSSLAYPVPIVIGPGGAGATDTNSGFHSGFNGGDTTFGPGPSYNVWALGGQDNVSNSTANGAQSYSTEKGGVNAGTPSTTHAGAAGGGGGNTHNTYIAPGSCSAGPGGPGGAGSLDGVTAAVAGSNYGGGGGAGAHQAGAYNAGAPGAPGVMLITVYS